MTKAPGSGCCAAPMKYDAMIEQYLDGPNLLRRAVAGMTKDRLIARPIPGRWSSMEVVCHIADYEPIYADRMKRVVALNDPELLKGDPGLFAARLAYEHREVEEEPVLIELTLNQMARILRALKPEVIFSAAAFILVTGHRLSKTCCNGSLATFLITSSSSRRRGEPCLEFGKPRSSSTPEAEPHLDCSPVVFVAPVIFQSLIVPSLQPEAKMAPLLSMR